MKRKLVHVVFSLLGIALLTAPGQAAGDPKGESNLAGSSPLPRGDGLAAKYPGDANIGSNPAVIFAEDFEEDGYRKRWDEARDEGGEVLALVPVGEKEPGMGRKALRVRATLGKNTGGGLTKWFQPVDTVFIRFYVKFDPECDYVHHFVTLRANKGLTGGDRWSGFGGAGLQP
jgi:hypothetical protein